MTAGPTLTEGPPPRRRLGWRVQVAIGLVLLLVVGAGVAAVTVRFARPEPAGAVRDYFSALSAGDAGRALRSVSNVGQLSPQEYPLLTDAGIAVAEHRPSHVHVGAVARIAGTPASIEASSVQASYRADGQTVSTSFIVLHSGDRYLLQAPFVEVAVQNAGGRAVAVNGVALGDQQLTTLAFPGGYDAVAAGNALFAGGKATGMPRPGPAGLLAAIDLGAPTLADGALDEIQKQARAQLDTCAASTQPTPPGCPFGLNVPGTAPLVHWSITTYPTIDAQVTQSLFGGVAVVVGGPGTGKVHWDIDYTGLTGDKRHESGDSDFTVNGSATLTGTGIQVSLVG
jgi:hypothetical protein